jgi:hypothetical protein
MESLLAGGRVPDNLLDYLASAPLPQSIWARADNPDQDRDWATLWMAREQNIVMARELQQARAALALIAASLPESYSHSEENAWQH